MAELSPLRQLRMGQLPKMVSWYDPRLLARIGEADRDIKGQAIGPVSTLTDLTLGLCRAWGAR